jgi:hypothetical protein
VFEAFREHAKSQRLGFRHRVSGGGTVRQNAR